MKQGLLFDVKATAFNLPSQVFFNIFKDNLVKAFLKHILYLFNSFLFIILSYMIECNNTRYEKYVS